MEQHFCEVYSEEIYNKMPLKGFIKLKDGSWREIAYHSIDGMVIIDGDIVLGEERKIISKDKMETEAIIFEPIRNVRWPNKTVYYEVDSALPNKDRITEAIKEWENKTSIRFVKRSNQPNYVYFIHSTGCSSHIGMIGGRQDIRLADNCSKGNVIHEMAHAIGLWHEQSREDRNSYVTIYYENIIEENKHNFDQHITDGEDVGLYDYGSLMHYPRNAFSKNGKDTIVPKDPDAIIGQRNGLSTKDIQALDHIYNALSVSVE
ncbi:hypothetical protein AWU65_18475 [Paenibacillus glucanolyticus]|uniref:Peptidase M12A domain-containing protein n=1 Tax=Paenibacillus glucanolyticus TaxID=59843 RepID=A0A163L2Z4_9BACL|nr:M12 family metallopeptidase [Paenibacillus glucanolyticus]KZS47766.1 hypothetical protein AWU65_18475 [Paenibacillus glucanolyticus]